jgi:maltose O-acetyltransferase
VHPVLILVQLLVLLIPRDSFGVARTAVYRLAGFRMGHRVRIYGRLTFSGSGDVARNFEVGDNTTINSPVHIELHAPVRIGKNCGIGHRVVIITMNHEFGPPSQRCGTPVPAPVTIGDGVWIGACVTILPGVTIGDGAFVATGTVVGRSIPPHARVGSPRMAVAGYFDDVPHAGAAAASSSAGGDPKG